MSLQQEIKFQEFRKATMGHMLFQVDAFAEEPFTGNPAAVCLVESNPGTSWMQKVAAEMNLSETAFLEPDDDDSWYLRWFTPTNEVDLCGHATLAAAHVLWEEKEIEAEKLSFLTKSGQLSARKLNGGIELNFPVETCQPVKPPHRCADILGASPVEVLANRMDLLLVFENEEQVVDLSPVLDAVGRWPYRGVIATASSAGRQDFVSRFFAPRVGVPEDPVTGSAHCALFPYWSDRFSSTKLTGFQASSRGGYVSGRIMGDRVFLGGNAITIFRGSLAI